MWRGISLRSLALLMAGPLLTDLLCLWFVFWMMLAAVRMGYPPRSQAWIGGLFAAGYIAGTQLAGRWLTPARAPLMVLLAVPALALIGTGSILLDSFAAYLTLAALVGATAGHYFAPFQVMMGDVRPFRTLAWTIAFYNISWGTGYMLGPLLSGLASDDDLASRDPRQVRMALVGLVWLVVAAHTALTLAARRAPRRPQEQVQTTAAFASTPAMRLSGLIAAAAGSTIMAGMLGTVWPNLGAARGLSNSEIAIGGALLVAPIPLLAMLWARLRRRMIHPWLLMGLLLLGATALVVMPLTRGHAALACLVCLGIAHSGVVFHAIYYNNAQPSAGRSVTTFETVVGLGNFLGPVLMGTLAWTDRASTRPFIFGAAAVLLAVALVARVRRPDRRAV